MFRFFSKSVILLAVQAAACEVAISQEKAEQRLEELRQRQQYDQALEFLDKAVRDPEISSEFKETVPYQRGRLLIEASKREKDVEVRESLMLQGRDQLIQFVTQHEANPAAIEARKLSANVQIERARIRTKKAEQKNGDAREELYADSRVLYLEAQRIFEKLEDDLRSRLKALPMGAGPDERRQIQMGFLEARLLSAATVEELADTYAKESAERVSAFTEASKRYEGISHDFRTRLAGLYARMYQARCQQKLGHHKVAIEILGELLTHRDSGESLHDFRVKVMILAIDSWMEEKEYKKIVDNVTPLMEGTKDVEKDNDEFKEMREKLDQAVKALAEQSKEQK